VLAHPMHAAERCGGSARHCFAGSSSGREETDYRFSPAPHAPGAKGGRNADRYHRVLLAGQQGPFAMTGENEEPKGPLVIPSLRIRIARYREQAAHFARLAEGEPVATIRDQWKELARNYAYLASTLESDLSRRSRAARRID
jgi:hypothetical protein